LIVTELVSLDGVMEAPGGEPGYAHTGWVGNYFSDELGQYKLEEQLASDLLLLGRVTYESFYGAWPLRDGPMAEKINTMDKLVVSNTLASSDWAGTTVIGGDVEATIAGIKQSEGGSILVAGSRTLAQSLLLAGLVDELRLQVMPVILGSGRRLYPERPEAMPLALIESLPLPDGVLAQTYRPTTA
jgi:dihydrofolate reductase